MSDAPVRPKVLLADDEEFVRDLIRDSLEEAGYEVVVAGTGLEALSVLASHRDFIALETDINFGGPPAGWEVATQAREFRADIAIVYMTGDSGHEWSAHGVPQSALVTKPFAPSQITVALASQLNTNGGPTRS